MSNLGDFNAEHVDPHEEITAIPTGKYTAMIVASEMKTAKSGGEYLELTFQITEGEYKDRKVWSRLNLKNQNPLVMQIAQGQLSSICRAVDVMKPGDSSRLHNREMTISVKCKKRTDTGDMTNDISGYDKKKTEFEISGQTKGPFRGNGG